ncbi:MAG: aminodeoxychorismate/anthranilate synthase component II [Methanomassiliicoccales archaeon]
MLLIDNYDSFSYNLYQSLSGLGVEVEVKRNDEVSLKDAIAFQPDAIVISPGPGHPANRRDFGVCAELLTTIARETPTLGVCLGHQGLAHTFGAKVNKLSHVVHGKTSLVYHFGDPLYNNVPSPFEAARYHSLIVDSNSLPHELKITAMTKEGEIMGLRHRKYPIEGVQFHPESILTPVGKIILANFLQNARR